VGVTHQRGVHWEKATGTQPPPGNTSGIERIGVKQGHRVDV